MGPDVRLKIVTLFIILVALLVAGCSNASSGLALSPEATGESTRGEPKPRSALDLQLRTLIEEKGIVSIEPVVGRDPDLVTLGQALFFDPILSGNRDIACATCHHPSLAGGDGIPLSIGTGGGGLGKDRQLGPGRRFVPRNAPDVFNRGAEEWTSMFWDGRIATAVGGKYVSPAGNQLPDGLDGVLAVQAMFPVTSRDEMRGSPGDGADDDKQNELARYADDDLSGIWAALMDRLLAIPGYRNLFRAAYPELPVEALGFEHAANAMAAFQATAFTLNNSPWDRYLRGEDHTLNDDAKRGALLFYGQAGCANCHSGPLFTDQAFHVLATPQIGPGKGEGAPWDTGRMEATSTQADAFAFRTPSLRNVALTGPYTHNGAYSTLESVIRHHIDPAASLADYDPEIHLLLVWQSQIVSGPAMTAYMLDNLDPLLAQITPISEEQLADLIAFLEALSDPAALNLAHMVPPEVPSGLPVADGS